MSEHSTSHIDIHPGDTLFPGHVSESALGPAGRHSHHFVRERSWPPRPRNEAAADHVGDYAQGGHQAAVVVRGGVAHGGGQWDPRRHYPAARARVRLGVRSQGARHRGVRRRGP